MNLKDAYVRTSDRYLASSREAIKTGLHEVSIFSTYHSFESIGGALCEDRGAQYPWNHQRKINQFKGVARPFRFARGVAHLGITLASLRSQSLYPSTAAPHGFVSPDLKLSLADAKSLHTRVRGVVGAVKRVI